jgi:hypothetical protein
MMIIMSSPICCATAHAAETRICEALAQAGIFAMGGAPVETHAFLNLGNLLCVRWSRATSRTEDIDLAHDPRVEVATPDVTDDIEAELKARGPGFLLYLRSIRDILPSASAFEVND